MTRAVDFRDITQLKAKMLFRLCRVCDHSRADAHTKPGISPPLKYLPSRGALRATRSESKQSDRTETLSRRGRQSFAGDRLLTTSPTDRLLISPLARRSACSLR